MLFNTYQFAYFFLLLFPAYWSLRRFPRLQNGLLLAAGYYFYACWNPKFLALLLLSTVMDYACGIWVDRAEDPRRRKVVVGLSMALNLGLLGYFKYYNFFAESLQAALAKLDVSVSLTQLNVVLPIGISFYTFQSMSYVIDVYRRDLKPTRDFIQFATFVSFFPHLVAGPIMRPTSLLPQVASPRRFHLTQFYEGVYLIFWGLVKKIVVADNLAVLVDSLFGRWQTLDGGTTLLAVYAFAFQIYGDFSGYTDIARGVAKCLGFELALNFNLPYFATSPKDFWNRWHISLSHWLRDYLYFPLGGGRGTKIMVYRNLMITMILGGLWHGAAWTYVFWGVYQGLLLVGHRIATPWLERIQPTDPVDARCWKALRIVVTFHLVCVGWLIFRADSMEQVLGMLSAVASRPAIPAAASLVPVLVIVLPLMLVQSCQYLSKELAFIARTPWYVRSGFYTACFYALVLGGAFGGGKQFIYFQF
ncbi:MBOAT family O-acyltransferase [Paludisphaera mucosa]|uniref:MBOAT family protein n=1 Tax=Paludisphaera mucosa TaxID=3030827 RepID=A0ABT6F6F1_9BACT|nr:MBOAT family protein [Paludisphaera mucosa]MDG3002998.1 MBOAT family protein [Paludisphaera mucosa]